MEYLSSPLLSGDLKHIVDFGLFPGTSLRALRAAAPYFLAITYYVIVKNVAAMKARALLCGFAAGMALLWSNDFAIPAAGLFSLLVFFDLALNSKSSSRELAIYAVSAGLSSFVVLTLTTAGYPIRLLRYNLSDVAWDQWWYFGGYSNTDRIFSLADASRLFSTPTILSIIVFLATGGAAGITRRLELVLICWIGCVLFAGGLVASVAGHLGDYFFAFALWAVVVTIIAAMRLAWFARKYLSLAPGVSSSLGTAVLIGACAVAVFVVIASARQYRAQLSQAENDSSRFYVRELGGYLATSWRPYTELAKTTNIEPTVEEYWGIWSAVRRTFPPWPVDSVIHALGRARQAAAGGLADAQIVISTRNLAAPDWQPWSLSQNFWFYEDLLANWTPTAMSPTTVVWSKGSRPIGPSLPCRAEGDHRLLLSGVSTNSFYAVEVQYRFKGSFRHLLMIRNNISFAAGANGYVSLDPSAPIARFPFLSLTAGSAAIDVKVLGPGAYVLLLGSCSTKQIQLQISDVLHVPGSASKKFFLTDANWVRGVARRWAGFFIPNTEQFADKYKPGRSVKFADGEVRKIIRVEPSGKHVNIYVEGEPLNPSKAGLPSDYTVIP